MSYFWNIVLLDIEFLVDFLSFPSPFLVCYPTAFWPPWFLKSKQLLIRLRTFICEVMWQILSRCSQDVSMYAPLLVYLTWNLLGVSWIFGLVFSLYLKLFQPLSFSLLFVALFFISSFGMSIMYISIHLRVSQRFLRLISIFFILFSLCCSGWIISISPPSTSLIIWPVHIYSCTPVVSFLKFQLFYNTQLLIFSWLLYYFNHALEYKFLYKWI